jgi:hypothetical protein
MTGEGEVSTRAERRREGSRSRKAAAERRTIDHASLQRGLVPCLRSALLLQYLLEVVVYENLGALGYGGSHLLQARRHRVLQSLLGGRASGGGGWK